MMQISSPYISTINKRAKANHSAPPKVTPQVAGAFRRDVEMKSIKEASILNSHRQINILS
jgi:hypothetical protein